MSKPEVYRYQPLPNAEERICSSRLLARSIAMLLRENPVSFVDEHKKDILGATIWKLTEAETGKGASSRGSGKYGTRYCSEAVWRDRNDLREKVQHEHVVPKADLIKALLERDESEVDGIIERAIGCVVYESEHPRKKNLCADLNGWARYKDANIRVVDSKKTTDLERPYFVPETC